MNYSRVFVNMALHYSSYAMFTNACFDMVFPKHQYSLLMREYGFANRNKLLLSVILFSLFVLFFKQNRYRIFIYKIK